MAPLGDKYTGGSIMATLYEQLLPQIADQFSFLSENNIEILRQMNSGFSGAEVYEIELKAPSLYTGKFFLKIDQKDEEYINHTVGKEFPHSVEYIKTAIIDSYYVLLIQLAGNSGIEYKSFFHSDPSVRMDRIPMIIEECLEASINKASFAPERMSLSQICEKMLGGKIASGGVLETFLTSKLIEPVNCCIQFEEALYPNPLFYARNNCPIKDCCYLPATIHGDFHGENIFLAQHDQDYAIIDWALAREDGILFFDDAYFELSIMLHTLENYPSHKWMNLVEDICNKRWENLDFSGASIIQAIHEQEDAWVKKTNTTKFSHADKMRLGQSIARVIAGLNFAGKKAVSSSQRACAFLFSCVFLKQLMAEAQYSDWATFSVSRWNQSQQKGTASMANILSLAEFCDNFSEEYQYILICGSLLPQQAPISDSLVRIPWRGILSLSTLIKHPLAEKTNEVKRLQHLILTQKEAMQEETIQTSDVWWAFVNGLDNVPGTLADTFPMWRNRYRKFLQRITDKICSAAPPQELMLIIAYDTFETEDEVKKARTLLEYFDSDESGSIQAVVLSLKSGITIGELANIQPRFYNADLDTLADYATTYLYGQRKAGIWLPQIDRKYGIQLQEDDEHFIGTSVEVIGDHLLDPGVQTEDVLAFYWGEPVTWDAIDRRLPVNRCEVGTLVDELQRRLIEEQWGRYDLSHTPGSGASVLVRQVCWQLRKTYPVVRIKQITSDMFESLRRIASLTGLPILILLDGDYTSSEAEAVEAALRSDLVSRKYVLLYTYRVYDQGETTTLPILDVKTAELFAQQYGRVLSEAKDYPPDETARRKEALQTLTQTEALSAFRLPFFYGMYAFKEDFVSVSQYVDDIMQRLHSDTSYCKIVSYLAIITYFTATFSLSHKIAKKLFSQPHASLRNIRNKLNDGIPSFVYVVDASYRICHPIIAYQLLINLYGDGNSLATSAFCKICQDFIQDIRELDGGETPSNYVNELISSIFLKRNLIDSADATQDNSRNTFATIILQLNNTKLQEEIFQCLVGNFPENPHCYQHFGRLLSLNSPGDYSTAKEQFDKAIHLDRKNPVHYHARGTMYLRYCRHILLKGELLTPEDVYNRCKNAVERALQDFETAVAFIQEHTDYQEGKLSLSYPYSSILNTCTTIVGHIKRRYERKYPTPFWEGNSEIVLWCRSIMSTAMRYDMSTVQEHPEVEQNPYYAKAKKNLLEVNLSQDKLKALIDQRPQDQDLKIFYLNNVDTRWDALSKLPDQKLQLIQEYCETVICQTKTDKGILWKWFQVSIHRRTFQEAHTIAFLETLLTLETSVTANYLLQILYFCRFYRTGDVQDAELSLRYQARCRELSRESIIGERRRSCRFFLDASKTPPLADNRENATRMDCTLIEDVVKEQSAYMTLDLYPKFEVVFVPRYNKTLKIGQGFGMSVKAAIGFSYNGFYGFDLEPQ